VTDGRPAATIILPVATNAVRTLRCLEGIAAQGQATDFEVLLAAGREGPPQGLLDALGGDFALLRHEGPPTLAAALAVALPHARGEVVVLLRDLARPRVGWLAPLIAALQDPSVGVALSAASAPSAHPLEALAFAARRAELRAAPVPEAPDALLLAAIALAAAERGLSLRTVPTSRLAANEEAETPLRCLPPDRPELAIVIPTLDAGSERVRRCLAAVHAHTECPNELIIVDNGAPPQGFTAPVNAGVRASSAPYVAVLNDDVEVLEGWWPPLREALQAGAEVACPLTVEGAMRDDFPAWCFAFARARLDVISHAPGQLFDPELVIWFQDTDLLRRLRALGRPPVIVERSRIRHALSRTLASEDPALRAWVQAQVQRDRERFLQKYPDAILQPAQLLSS